MMLHDVFSTASWGHFYGVRGAFSTASRGIFYGVKGYFLRRLKKCKRMHLNASPGGFDGVNVHCGFYVPVLFYSVGALFYGVYAVEKHADAVEKCSNDAT